MSDIEMIKALIAENEELRKDAERYRYLRLSGGQDLIIVDVETGDYMDEMKWIIDGDDLDAKIDQLIAEKGK